MSRFATYIYFTITIYFTLLYYVINLSLGSAYIDLFTQYPTFGQVFSIAYFYIGKGDLFSVPLTNECFNCPSFYFRSMLIILIMKCYKNCLKGNLHCLNKFPFNRWKCRVKIRFVRINWKEGT